MEDLKILQDLASFLKEIPPLAWEAALKQVRAEIIGFQIWSVLVLAVALFSGCMAWWGWKKSTASDDIYPPTGYIVLACVGTVVAITFGFIAVDLMMSAVQRMNSPEYFAMKLLFQLAQGQ